MAKRFLTPLNLTNLASDPETGTEGDLYYNTVIDAIKIYINGSWTELQGGTGGGGASVIYSAEQPDTTNLDAGTIWVDSDGDITQATRGIGSYTRWTKLITASASLISGFSDDSILLNFDPGLEQVYINGVFIDNNAYTTTGTSITFDDPLFVNDIVEILWLENFSVVNDIYTKEEVDNLLSSIDLTSAITTASAAAVSAISDGAPEVLDTLNELAAALEDNADILDLYITQVSASTTYATKAELAAFSSETFLIKEENYATEVGDVVFVNSASGAYTMTLPSTPTLGDRVRIIDLANNAASNNITIGRNSENIDGEASDFIIDLNNAGVEFIYTNNTYGWRTISG